MPRGGFRQNSDITRYLRFRLAHVLAELRRDNKAADMLDEAVDCGFLSVRLTRREEVVATARISASERYCATMRRLERRVAACAAAYAPDILPVPVAATA
jgi:predicted negative regulator of RcsB-dependent stress response